MATIVKEDGSGLINANSYVTVAELTTFSTDRQLGLPDTDNDAMVALLLKAMDFLEGLWYKGSPTSAIQTLKFPRAGIYVDGVEIPDGEVPAQLPRAQMALCVIANSTDLVPIETPQDANLTMMKVGPITFEYDYKAGSSIPRTSRILGMLYGLLESPSAPNSGQIPLVRIL